MRRSLRNLARSPVRSLLIAGLLSVVLAGCLISLMLRSGAEAAAESIAGQLGNVVQLRINLAELRAQMRQEGADYAPQRSASELMRMGIDEALADSLSTLPWVAHYDKSIQLSAGSPELESLPEETRVNFGNSSGGGFQIMGHLDASAAAEFAAGIRELQIGHLFSAQDSLNANHVALIDEALAEYNGLALGDIFALSTQRGGEEVEPLTATVTIIGIFATTRDEGGAYFRDPGNTIYVSLATARALDNREGGEIDSASFHLHHAGDYDAFHQAALDLGMDSDRYDLISNQRDYMAFAGSLLEVRDAARWGLWVFLLAGAVTIMLLMALMARERKREIGILCALGARKSQVIGGFFTEAVALSLIALLFGTMLAGYLGQPIASYIADRAQENSFQQPDLLGGGRLANIGQAGGRMRGFAGMAMGEGWSLPSFSFVAQLGGWELAAGIGITLLLAIIGTILPTISCLRMRPSDILRSE